VGEGRVDEGVCMRDLWVSSVGLRGLWVRSV